MKLKATASSEDFTKHVHRMTSFVMSHYSAATMISENGGLLTYRVPKEQVGWHLKLAATQ